MKIKKLLILTSIFCGLGVLAFAKPLALSVNAEESNQVVETANEFKGSVDQFIETYAKPLMLALGGLNIGGLAGTAVIAIISSKKEKARKKANEVLTSHLLIATELLNEATSKFNEEKEKVEKCYEEVLDLANKAIVIAQSVKESTKGLDEMKKSLIAMANALIIQVKNSKEAVVSGAKAEIAKIEEQLKELI